MVGSLGVGDSKALIGLQSGTPAREDRRRGKALTLLGEAIQSAVKRFNPFRKMIDRIRKARANRAATRC